MLRNIYFISAFSLWWGLAILSVDSSQLCDQTVFRCPYEQTCFDYYRKSECTGRTNRHHSDVLSCRDAKLHKICLDVKTVCAATNQDGHLIDGMHHSDFRTGSSGLCSQKHTNDGNSCYDHSQCPAVSGGVALCCHQRCVHVHNVPGVRDFFKEEDRLCTDHELHRLDYYHHNGHSSGSHGNHNNNDDDHAGHSSGSHSNNNNNNNNNNYDCTRHSFGSHNNTNDHDEFYHTLIQSLGRTKNAMRKIEIATNGSSNPGTNLALVRQTSAINVRLVQFASFIPDVPTGAACVSESSAIVENIKELIQRANETTGCPSDLSYLTTDGFSAGNVSGEIYYGCLLQQEGQLLAEILSDRAHGQFRGWCGSGYYLNMVRKFAREVDAVKKAISRNDESCACSKAIQEFGQETQAVMQSPDDGGGSDLAINGTNINEASYKNTLQAFARINNLLRKVEIATLDTSNPGPFLIIAQQASTYNVRFVGAASMQADLPTGAGCVDGFSSLLNTASGIFQYINDTTGCPNNLDLLPTDGISGGGVSGEDYYHCLVQQFGFYLDKIMRTAATVPPTDSGYYLNMMRTFAGSQNAVSQLVSSNDTSGCSVAYSAVGRGFQSFLNTVDVDCKT